MRSSRIADCPESLPVGYTGRLRTVARVPLPFPGVCAGTAQNWPLGNSALAISNLAWPSVVYCGVQNSGRSHHANVPSRLPGLSEVGALQHLSLMLTLFRVSSWAACLRRT